MKNSGNCRQIPNSPSPPVSKLLEAKTIPLDRSLLLVDAKFMARRKYFLTLPKRHKCL
jgi:hypothetical protein